MWYFRTIYTSNWTMHCLKPQQLPEYKSEEWKLHLNWANEHILRIEPFSKVLKRPHYIRHLPKPTFWTIKITRLNLLYFLFHFNPFYVVITKNNNKKKNTKTSEVPLKMASLITEHYFFQGGGKWAISTLVR